MHPAICPTITATDESTYGAQMNVLSTFATRIHIDIADGKFTPNKLIDIDKIWWPGGVLADIHVMYKRPFDKLKEILALGPQLIIVHAEADINIDDYSKLFHKHGVEIGVALLRDTPLEKIQSHLNSIDHILVFSGTLGYHGGTADLGLLEKVKSIKFMQPRIEIGWDGGINDQNIKELIDGGVDVLNVGGYIANADYPVDAYAKLKNSSGI